MFVLRRRALLFVGLFFILPNAYAWAFPGAIKINSILIDYAGQTSPVSGAYKQEDLCSEEEDLVVVVGPNVGTTSTLLIVHEVMSCRSVGVEDIATVRMAKETGDQVRQGA
jgi:hypothetical protein